MAYTQAPGWSFGYQERGGNDRPKYEFYENAAFLDDPITADQTRKMRVCAPKIGTEPRMPLNTLEQTPGPQYFPKPKPEEKKDPQYTFGYRRGAGGALKNQTSTPNSVGPARYFPENAMNPSTKTDHPRWTLPKAGRPANERRPIDKNQTYDTRSGFGKQQYSKNKSSGVCHFGSGDRHTSAKLGTFKDMMTGTAKVKIDHPKW